MLKSLVCFVIFWPPCTPYLGASWLWTGTSIKCELSKPSPPLTLSVGYFVSKTSKVTKTQSSRRKEKKPSTSPEEQGLNNSVRLQGPLPITGESQAFASLGFSLGTWLKMGTQHKDQRSLLLASNFLFISFCLLVSNYLLFSWENLDLMREGEQRSKEERRSGNGKMKLLNSQSQRSDIYSLIL